MIRDMRNSAKAYMLLVFAALPLQARDLHWRELDVRATLANDGALHVTERHTMVFSGDWNGGERIFRLEPDQTFQLDSVKRVDAQSVPHDLVEGDLSGVDRYAWTDANTLRWRSRSPSDPEFQNTELTYVLDYTYANILVPNVTSAGYTLNHDFAFANRPGVIEHYDLTLTLGSAWNAPNGPVIRRHAKNLVSGESYIVTLDLTYHGEAKPAAMSNTMAAANLGKPWFPFAAMLLALLVFLGGVVARARATVTDDAPIDDAWLQRNVFRLPPEVAGTFLHGDVGAPEFAALLGRMEQEGQIRTWTTTEKGEPNLNLELLVDIHSLDAPGQALASKLFASTKVTSTEALRKKYKHHGFDPPAVIRPRVLVAAQRFAVLDLPVQRRSGKWLFFAGLAIAVFAALRYANEFLVLLAILAGGGCISGLGIAPARAHKRSGSIAGLVVLSLLPLFGLVIVLAHRLHLDISLAGVVALTAGWTGAYVMILGAARETMSIEGAALRKMLRRARGYFRAELKNPRPALRDEWTPWLIALGLQRPLASWWRVHGGDETSSAAATSSSTFSSTSSSSFGSSSPNAASSGFTGGGGSFGGAGATGTWGLAAMSLASGVAAPAASSGGGGGSYSSSSGGGSSSGGSSSGGGGGGGW